MYNTLLPVLVLQPHHLIKVDGSIVGIKVHFLDIPEAYLHLRLSACNPVKESIRPLVFKCKYNDFRFKATFFHDCMVIQ